jgi:hypothetical protein
MKTQQFPCPKCGQQTPLPLNVVFPCNAICSMCSTQFCCTVPTTPAAPPEPPPIPTSPPAGVPDRFIPSTKLVLCLAFALAATLAVAIAMVTFGVIAARRFLHSTPNTQVAATAPSVTVSTPQPGRSAVNLHQATEHESKDELSNRNTFESKRTNSALETPAPRPALSQFSRKQQDIERPLFSLSMESLTGGQVSAVLRAAGDSYRASENGYFEQVLFSPDAQLLAAALI